MPYPVKNKKRGFKYSPYGSKEEQLLLKKYKGKVPPFKEISRTESRKILRVPEKLHKKGELVQYEEGKVGVITKVTKKGIYVNQIQSNGIAKIKKKPTFISEEELREGEAYPYYVLTLV
ncbi:MAG: hypothetical protein ACFFDN_06940 [Candidatus Hodarchaeota archaeon]